MSDIFQGINVETPDFVPLDDHVSSLYAVVLPDLDTMALAGKTFHYRIPSEMVDQVQPGVLVVIPFGRIPQRLGLVLHVSREGPPVCRSLLSIVSTQPVLDDARLRWLHGIAQATMSSFASVIATAIPPSLLKISQNRLKTQLRPVRHTRALQPLAKEAGRPRHQDILDCLWRQPTRPVPLKTLRSLLKPTPGDDTLHRMAEAGLVQWVNLDDPQDTTRFLTDDNLSQPVAGAGVALNDAQQAVVETFWQGPPGTAQWLYGVTGSGKTQVYLAIAERLLAKGQGVLMLVPEIALTSQLAQAFIHRFGRGRIALWHSKLSATERADTWWRLSRGELRLVIGPRSALFLPVTRLGAILMDEAHDGSYKQDSPTPRYDAREAAVSLARAMPDGCRVLFGSATPDVARFARAREAKTVMTLPARFGNRAMAEVEIINMRNKRQLGQLPILSSALQEALADTLAAGRQAIILVNRRGFYTQVQCQACDHTLICPHCNVAITVHLQSQTVRCHYCGWQAPIPTFCPLCAGFHLRHGGVGTQRVAQTLAEQLPQARILRLDSDVLSRKNAHHAVFSQFSAHRADILVGTQLVAKGLDMPNVTLVGVIGADGGLNMPDYLAGERTFQLLTQVAGRAGRGEHPGRVLVQTRMPEHPVIQLACRQDYDRFFEYELAFRRQEAFPPYSQLIRVLVSSENEEQAESVMAHVAERLHLLLEGEAVDLLGPAPCVISKIQDRYRFHLLIKNRAGRSAHRIIADWFQGFRHPKDLHCLVDVGAQSLL